MPRLNHSKAASLRLPRDFPSTGFERIDSSLLVEEERTTLLPTPRLLPHAHRPGYPRKLPGGGQTRLWYNLDGVVVQRC